MRVLAQSAHRPSRVPPSKLDRQEDGPRSPNVNRMQCLSRVESGPLVVGTHEADIRCEPDAMSVAC